MTLGIRTVGVWGSGRSGQPVMIHDFDQPKAWFVVPSSRVMPPGTGTMHVILAVTDHGTPRLTRTDA